MKSLSNEPNSPIEPAGRAIYERRSKNRSQDKKLSSAHSQSAFKKEDAGLNQENPYEPPSITPTIIDQSEKQSLASMVNAEKNYENFLLEKIFKISDILG